jgi:predicted RecB family nuclease
MFLLDDDTVVYSASDLANAAACEFALLRALDAKLGRIEPVILPTDTMLQRVARLGNAHEALVLAEYVARFGPWNPTTGRGVAQIERPDAGRYTDRASLEAKHGETLDALRTGADVVFQAGFFDGRFGGWADFLVRERREPGEDRLDLAAPDGGSVYAVYDTKLARHAKIIALLQLAAYADQLLAAGVRPAAHVHLILGDRTVTSHRLDDLLPAYRERRRRLETILDERQGDDAPVAWGDDRYRACLRCEVCAPELAARRDVVLVAGLRNTQRARLNVAGVTTIDELASSVGRVDGIGASTLDGLRAQARLQARQNPPGGSGADAAVQFELYAPDVVGALPTPSPGDIFFDFEGDPLWIDDDASAEDQADWGLEYLFGVIEAGSADFRPFWAHDRTQEKQALVDFLAYVAERRTRFPDMHVYHYAAYEKTTLLKLAGRHGVGEVEVDGLLAAGILVDLYATVRASLRTGQNSYSLKKLEPLYMDVGREGDVKNAASSIVEYAEACAERDAGRLDAWDARLKQIADYNMYDCLSTLRLRDWLLARAAEHGVAPQAAAPVAATPEADAVAPEDDVLAGALLAFADAQD